MCVCVCERDTARKSSKTRRERERERINERDLCDRDGFSHCPFMNSFWKKGNQQHLSHLPLTVQSITSPYSNPLHFATTIQKHNPITNVYISQPQTRNLIQTLTRKI